MTTKQVQVTMKYDEKADAMVLEVENGDEYSHSDDTDGETIFDFSKSGKLLRIEMLNATKRGLLSVVEFYKALTNDGEHVSDVSKN